MKRIFNAAVAAFIVALALSLHPAQASTAQDAWNAIARSHGFVNVPTAPGVTFAQGYHGSNFAADLHAAWAEYQGVFAGPIIDPDDDDLMNVTIQ